MVEYEFGGPVGALGVILGLPLVILGLYFSCAGVQLDGEEWCLGGPEDLGDFLRLKLPPVAHWWSMEALGVFTAWFLFQVILERFLPGQTVEGAKLKNGERLKYRINAHLAFWVSLLVMGHAWPRWECDTNGAHHVSGFGMFPLEYLYDHYLQLATASIAFSFALSIYVYLGSFIGKRLLAEGGQTGNVVYDFFIGRELNPRLGSFDWKYFCELRPGLIGWQVLNIGMAVKQAQLHGTVSPSMILVNLFQGLYVWDALFQERAILTTMDITTDGFGFMLAFGDLAWVPFTYTLQARYLVNHDPGLSWPFLGAVAVLNTVGYVVFRGANSQKDAFRRNPKAPEVVHLKYMDTKRGSKLLISGYWGLARKINYTGDWCMGLSWCLLTGFGSIITYFYAIYFGILLIHRALRDDGFCAEKYGEDWGRYKEKVPSIFVPWLI